MTWESEHVATDVLTQDQHLTLRGQLSQICDVYMHLVKLIF